MSAVVLPFQKPVPAPSSSKADGVFTEINCAARVMGFDANRACRAATTAKLRYLRGGERPEHVVSAAMAALRAQAMRVQA